MLILGRTRKVIPPPWYSGFDGTLPPSFRYVAVFGNDFHLKGKTSILGLLLMIADKEAEITVTLLLYEVCRKYYEVQGSYVEITYFGF